MDNLFNKVNLFNMDSLFNMAKLFNKVNPFNMANLFNKVNPFNMHSLFSMANLLSKKPTSLYKFRQMVENKDAIITINNKFSYKLR